MEQPIKKLEKIKLKEINPYLTCHLCKGYLIDATTISECLHSFCRSCIIKFLQENSHCPVCEVIINKAKPNLKLDKTLQDVVYKLVPELFLREMTRRRLHYQQYPEIAARVSPEERGEDTERTIFNPQDCISLSLEFISDDSTPGAITLLSKNGLNTTDKQLGDTEDAQTLMKRYLQCPGMCRIEVLKKFVRNKYNVDTSKFYIDILYKKVPLPDHYTLIDIAYIYTWRRNEPMKFYFRITDVNKETDGCGGDSTPQKSISSGKTPTRTPKVHADRSAKKRESVRQKNSKVNQTKANLFNKLKKEVLIRSHGTHKVDSSKRLVEKTKKSDKNSCTKTVKTTENSEISSTKAEVNEKIVNGGCKVESSDDANTNTDTKLVDKNVSEKCKPKKSDDLKVSYKITSVGANLENNNNINITIKKERSPIKQESEATPAESSDLQKETPKQLIKQENDPHKDQNRTTPEIAERLGNKASLDESIEDIKNTVLKSEAVEQSKTSSDKSDSKNAVYTSITLNRSNNMEIITKIQKVSNKEGQAIGLNIIKQTVQKSAKVENKPPKQVLKLECDKKPAVKEEPESKSMGSVTSHGTDKSVMSPVNDTKECIKAEAPTVIASSDHEEEKLKFLRCVELTAKNAEQDEVQKKNTPIVLSVQSSASQKRKNSSPIKNDKSKKMKTEGRKPGTKRIIIQPKVVHPPTTGTATTPVKPAAGLQSIIENCKIPSSLSITIKEGNDASRLPPLVPPVKNYIEILKLPDESTKATEKPAVTSSSGAKFNFTTICDNDSEQKVDEDLSEIARSLTEKIPMSTTISQIVGPKPQYPIPVKSSTPAKLTILPSPVPEVPPPTAPSKVLTLPKDNVNPKSPQTFQKIFEESIKRPDAAKSPEKDTSQKSALDLSDASATSNNSKRNILEIASKLYKKTKMEQEKCNPEVKVDEPSVISNPPPLPKVPIPRLSNHRYMKPQTKIKNVKFEVTDPTKYTTQTLANLHSNALGLNYTISIGHNLNQNVTCMPPTHKKEEIKTTTVRVIPPSSSFTPPKESSSSSPKPSPIPKISPGLGLQSPKSSPKHSPKSSPIIKHMYAPVPSLMMDQHRVQSYTPKIPSPKPASPKLPLPMASPTMSLPSPSLKSSSPKPSSSSPKPSPKATDPVSIKASSSSEASSSSSSIKPLSVKTPSSSKNSPTAKGSPKAGSSQSQNSPLSPNQILEKYNIQNLAQLTASLNFNPAAFGLNPSNQLAALQHAMLLKHFEMQNRQNWLANLNQGPLLQYEKYLQSLKANQNPLLGNIKEN
ncbi:unnamed protein product [Callosobruchus maculatus]|uniref:RING-type domain-containing protein n=1 Tax=Callosobruchus maculatus TaxID=64391 RepID=A0A653CJZ6_CALMS|nr:unnamed protein product [Callosobruchus maculatus]